jgi:hypothetical protein
MSKGSHRRQEDVKKVRDNWDLIFGKKDEPVKKESKDIEEKPKTK